MVSVDELKQLSEISEEELEDVAGGGNLTIVVFTCKGLTTYDSKCKATCLAT